MQRRDFLRSSMLTATIALPGFGAYAAVRPGKAPDIAAVTGNGREVMLSGKDIDDLCARLTGTVLLAGDAGYDQARLILNPSFNRRPAVIIQPATVADVQSAVQFARSHSLLVAVKCGGHSHSGQSTCDRGMQIDLSKLRGVQVDAQTKRANVMGGSLLGQVDAAATAQGFVTPLGTVSHTGVGGLTLGGGFGRLARRYGMAIDNLESVDVVTAEGKLLHASATENADLFWAVRGGGGNFGVATNFEFRLHPMQQQVVAGKVAYPIERAHEVLSAWAEIAANAPDDLYIDPNIQIPPGDAPASVGFEVCYSGPHANAEQALAPIRKLGKSKADTIKQMDYVVVQRMNDSGDNRAIASYLKSGFVPTVTKELVTAMVEGIQGDKGRATVLFFQHCGGASSRVPESATAFAHRDAVANILTMTAWPIGEPDAAKHIEATRRYWKQLEPFTRGFYVNDIAREATARDINANYRGNFARLAALKSKYDPTNLFRLNANVQPT